MQKDWRGSLDEKSDTQAEVDQAVEDAKELARVYAAFYKALTEAGVPPIPAGPLTLLYFNITQGLPRVKDT